MYGVFRAYHVFLLAGMPVCYIYKQQEGRQAELPKGRRDFKMTTLDVTEERRRAIDRVNRAYADEDYDRYERPSSAIVKGSGLTAITVFLRMPARMPACSVTESARGGNMTLEELFEETCIQGEIAIQSYDSTGTTIEHYLGNAEEFYPDEHPQILEREVGYIFPLMEVEPTICIELKDEG